MLFYCTLNKTSQVFNLTRNNITIYYSHKALSILKITFVKKTFSLNSEINVKNWKFHKVPRRLDRSPRWLYRARRPSRTWSGAPAARRQYELARAHDTTRAPIHIPRNTTQRPTRQHQHDSPPTVHQCVSDASVGHTPDGDCPRCRTRSDPDALRGVQAFGWNTSKKAGQTASSAAQENRDASEKRTKDIISDWGKLLLLQLIKLLLIYV